ncbi:hypothetical protein, conserved [Angomonas deanei]|uniref:Uncharacterized protein n=1 Tax=Angomonas deanei TaxID=59799 RepID=A0A7G2CE82_9TRYP|nr:hypothetical protein, conserved [Angomonas deanei]
MEPIVARLTELLQHRDISIVVPLSRAFPSVTRGEGGAKDYCSTLLQWLFQPPIQVHGVVLLVTGVVAAAIASGASEECVVLEADWASCTVSHIKGGSTVRHAVSRLGSLESIRQGVPHEHGTTATLDLTDPVFRPNLLKLFGLRAYQYMLLQMRPAHGGTGKGKGRRRAEELEWVKALSTEEKRDCGLFARTLVRVVGRPPFYSTNPASLWQSGVKSSDSFLIRCRQEEGTVATVLVGDAFRHADGLQHLFQYVCDHYCNEEVYARCERERKKARRPPGKRPRDSDDEDSSESETSSDSDSGSSTSSEEEEQWLHRVVPLLPTQPHLVPLVGLHIATEVSCRSTESYDLCRSSRQETSDQDGEASAYSTVCCRHWRMGEKDVVESRGAVGLWRSVF